MQLDSNGDAVVKSDDSVITAVVIMLEVRLAASSKPTIILYGKSWFFHGFALYVIT